MSFTLVNAGKNVPQEINVIIEIPQDGGPVKYEVDKKIDMLVVDRFLGTSMRYPANYGYVPKTLSEDGDPVDVLVLTPYPLQIGSMIRARPVGMLRMTDESGVDTKILAVPVDKLCPHYRHVQKAEDLGMHTLKMIEHFFTHYKDLEAGKWVKIDGWDDVNAAHKEILASVERYKE